MFDCNINQNMAAMTSLANQEIGFRCISSYLIFGCFLLPDQQEDNFSFQPLTEMRFHVPAAVIPAIYKRQRPIMGEACNTCCSESKV